MYSASEKRKRRQNYQRYIKIANESLEEFRKKMARLNPDSEDYKRFRDYIRQTKEYIDYYQRQLRILL